VEVLLEVVAQRHVDERTPVRGQLHARGQTALNDSEVAGGESGSMRGPVTRRNFSCGSRRRAAAPGDRGNPLALIELAGAAHRVEHISPAAPLRVSATLATAFAARARR
jgi:hypothetical protein